MTLLRVRGLSKSYPMNSKRNDRILALAQLLTSKKRGRQITVLSDVTFDVTKGNSVGIIGENGAGKSTLLKLISGILTPTTGSVELNGSVAALIELGAGFHPEYTGRENIQMAAALMGMSKGELDLKLEEILQFADIGRYIDEPIKHYSSGMVVRLGFALIAAHRPDLLITDEVLAVGDEAFQRKCVRWIEDYLSTGGTLLLVSHSMYHIQKLCKSAIWIHHGQVEAQGDVFEVTQKYLAFQEQRIASQEQDRAIQAVAGEFNVKAIHFNGDTNDTPMVFNEGSSLLVSIDVESKLGRTPNVAVGVARMDGTALYGVTTEMEHAVPVCVTPNLFRFTIQFNHMQLLPGAYFIRAHAMDVEGFRLFDTVRREFTIRGESREFGLVRLPHVWQ